MQKTRNYTGLFLIFFIIAFIAMNIWKAAGNQNNQFALDAPTIPLMRVSNASVELTDLRGYRSDEAKSYAKSTVIPLAQSKKLTISLGPDLEEVSSLTYEIIRKKDEKLVADGAVEDFTKEEDYLTAQMLVEDELKEGTEYLICFELSLPRQEKIYYYAQLQYGKGFHVNENMEFVKQFHGAIFEKSDDISSMLPSEGESDNDFSQTTIESGEKEILFGDIEAKIEGDISYSMKEVKQKQMKTELTYIMSMQREERSKQYYRVEEEYEAVYRDGKVELVGYNRQVEAIFNSEFIYPSNQEILLGITNKETPDYLESDSGKKVCFVQGRQLWLYDYTQNTATEVFAFGGDNLDIRSNLDQNNIKPLSMDDDGNIDFLVYGYMSRGEHEGENGISLYHYDASSCLIEEKIFIDSNYKYSVLNSGIQRVAYFDGKTSLYLLLNGNLFRVNIQSSDVEKIEKDMKEENIEVSGKSKIVAIQKEENKNNREILLWNLDKGEKQEISCEENQRIKMIGFISEDFLYGIADEEDLPETGSSFPMQQFHIVNEEGENIKTYEKEGRYILNIKISGTVIRVGLGKKKGTKYQKIPMQEYIRYQNSDTGSITFLRHSDTVQWSQLYMKFPNYIYVQKGAKVRKTGILR